MKLICVSTSKNFELEQWEKKAKELGYEYTILGLGQEWKGFKTKITLVLGFLREQTPDELVAVVDCYDLLMVRPPEALIQAYAHYTNDSTYTIVNGAETRCGYNCEKQTCSHQKNFQCNGGFVMGPASHLIELYEYVLEHSPTDDQIGIGLYRNKHCNKVSLDTQRKLVANIYGLDAWRRELGYNKDKTIKFKPTGELPCAIHMPFMQADFGFRWQSIRTQVCGKFASPYRTGYFTKLFFEHCMRNYRTNAPLRLQVHIIFPIVLVLLIGLIVFVVVRNRRKRMRMLVQ